MSAGHLEDNILASYKRVEQTSRQSTKSKQWSGRGVIREEAEVKVGGSRQLEKAVARGAIQVIRQGAMREIVNAQQKGVALVSLDISGTPLGICSNYFVKLPLNLLL